MELQKKIDLAIKRFELGDIVEYEPANEFPSIGSDGIFRVTTTQGKFTVKIINNPDKLWGRTCYHLKAEKFLALPKLLGSGDDYLIFEFHEGSTLLHFLLSENPKSFFWYQKAFEMLLTFWDKTHKTTFQKRNCQELKIAREIVANEILQEAQNLPIAVNEKDTGLTFNQVFGEIFGLLNEHPIECMAHGDARLDNIIITNQNPAKILFIDLRPGFCWLDDLALLGWQNSFRFVNFSEPPKIKTNEWLEINFDLKPSTFAQQTQKFSLKLGQDFARQNGYLPSWQKKYHLILAASELCEIAGVLRRKQAGILDRTLPQNTEYFWLAEAVKNSVLANQK